MRLLLPFLVAISCWMAVDPALATPQGTPETVQLAHVIRSDVPVPLWQRLISLGGIVAIVGIAWLLSVDRKRMPWRVVGWGIGLQFCFGIFVLKTSLGLATFSFLNDVVTRLLQFSTDGARFVFGKYVDTEFTIALNVLPTIVFFSALMAVLYHVGVMQRIVKAVALVMQKTMRTSGSETLSAAANIFVGQTEAPLVVKPFLARMTRSELNAIMVGGFATVAGGVLAAYVGMLKDVFPGIAGHLIAASVLNAPAALVMAKVLVPETQISETADHLHISTERPDSNVIGATARGASEGLMLALNVGAMLVAFLALVALANFLLALPASLHNAGVWKHIVHALHQKGVPVPAGCSAQSDAIALSNCIAEGVKLGHLSASHYAAWAPWSLQRILGIVFWPIAFVMGTPVADCTFVASLLGEKTVLNEFVAYLHLGEAIRHASPSPRAVILSTYALCGFANFGSIGIQIGGIGSLAPERRNELARLGLRAMIGGSLASFLTASVAGVLV